MHPKELQEYLKILESTDISELEIKEGDRVVRIVRAIGGPHMASDTPIIVSHRDTLPVTAAAASTTSPAKASEPEKGMIITSPFVGTFYRSPSPTAAPYVEVGSTVNKGQIIWIVEAMKLMNEIESDYNGRVAQVYVESGQPVEYGDKLF